MNPLARRRAQLSPSEQRAAEDRARQQTALTVSIAVKQAKAEVQVEVIEALKQIAEAGNVSAGR